jgi:hypothetical protein
LNKLQTQWLTCGSQVVDDKSLIDDSTMDMAQWQSCSSQVADENYLMTDSTMANLYGSQVVDDKASMEIAKWRQLNGKPVVHKLWMISP